MYGEMGSLALRTLDAAPGEVRQLLIAEVYKDGFLAKWKPPNFDPQCVQEYKTTVKGPQREKLMIENLYNKVISMNRLEYNLIFFFVECMGV